MNKSAVVSAKDTQEVLNKINVANNLSTICTVIGAIFLIIGVFMLLKGLLRHMRGENGPLITGIICVVAFVVMMIANNMQKQQKYEQYAILVDDYDYTCWYEGKEVSYDTLDVDKYNIEVDSAGQMLKFTKPAHSSIIYIPIIH